MNFWTGFFKWAGKHPYLTFGLVLGGGYGTYKLGSKALDVTERTAKRAIKQRYSVKVGKVSVSPSQSYPEEEMIVDEEGCLTVEDGVL